MKYEFSNSEYIKAHGEAPNGKGYWAFTIKAEVPEIDSSAFIENYGGKVTTTFWVAGIWTLTEAKKIACRMLSECLVRKDLMVYVAP